MKITKITPSLGGGGKYKFTVVLHEDKEGWTVSTTANELLDYSLFRIVVLEATGRVYGDGTYHNWGQQLKTLIDEYRSKRK